MELTQEQIAQLQEKIRNATSLDDVMGKDGLINDLIGTIVNGLLEAERDVHLGYPPHAVEGHGTGNSRNGFSKKTVKSARGALDVKIPRDRDGSFTPTLIPPHRRVLGSLEDAVLALYAVGVSTRDISEQLEHLYGPAISPALVSQITDTVLPMMIEWQNRPLDPLYVMVFLDAIHLKVRRDGRVQTTAVYTCVGVRVDGTKHLLGLWIGDQEGARFWQGVLTDLANRGIKDMLFVCVDGLTGFPDAIATVFPRAEIQQCVIHAIRRSLTYVTWKDKKEFMQQLKQVYTAPTEPEAQRALDALAATWEKPYPQAIATWRNNWQYLSTYFAYPECIRRLIYTTNAVEAVHSMMRRATKTKAAFPNEEAALKLLFLQLRKLEAKWEKPLPNWAKVLNYIALSHHERVNLYIH